ncbi:MAG TPA: 2-oxoacid:acceptor oxidoreductase family protein [Aggregatilinea sp.]|uniref:2-oxoacid:acceptor oxidoreductase family protein n=1 Tax=Aggregatilinea sp. TaxID=2806333 RepID=UPI002CDE936B|nr:2-oxoacid:acceptor oxidoreductase family protein [Aggregatilinea sp.]HML24399.1 2-oxoacid:acceptor oxidoreductase family protein [Aggregatilinea sp.]
MHEELIFAGFGGQGVLFAGQLLAYTALAEEKHVTWIPSYGPEMRGGTANCTVIVSDDPIGSPVSQHPSIAVVFNHPSLDKYEEFIRPGGLLVVNSSLTMREPERDDIDCALLPATELANQLGNPRVANMILLGALLVHRPIVTQATIARTLANKLGPAKADLCALNLRALERGMALAQGDPA